MKWVEIIIEYFQWVISPSNIHANIFTLLSVVLSGVVSWVLSAIYFTIGNRNNLKASVFYPMRRILEEPPKWDEYRRLTEIIKDYSMKYSKKGEQTIVNNLLICYKEVCSYKYEFVCAESLTSYFYYTLKKNGIDPTPIPVYVEDEFVYSDYPPDMNYFTNDLEKVMIKYSLDYERENCETAILQLFKYYCKQCYTDKKINFFGDYTIDEVISKAKNKNEWDNKFKKYESAKNTFLNMRALK